MSNLPSSEERRFEERLAQAESRLVPPKKSRRNQKAEGETSSSFGMALQIGSDMVAGIAVGVGIGYGLDRWTGHKALFLILFTLLGFGASMRNVWRIVNAPITDVGVGKDGRNQRGQRIDD